MPSETVPPLTADMEPSLGRRLTEFMLLARRMETRTVELYRQGTITGGCYTGIGNEATSVGAAQALADGDVLVPTHRDLGAHLVRGHGPLEIARQYLKTDRAQTRGRDSGLHLGREGGDVVGMISHLAHMMPVACGIAWAERVFLRDRVVLTTVGDGATSLGDFHESLNFAAVQKLPLIVIIENNQYAYSTPVTMQYACERLSDRAAGYGMSGMFVDGTDVVEVFRTVSMAVERARQGGGPSLIEARTMRMRGHSEHDDFAYVPTELLERWARWDPVERVKAHALQTGWLSHRALDDLEQAVAQQVEEAFRAAMGEPRPDPDSAAQDVFRSFENHWQVPSGRNWSMDEGHG